jgi:hypothetical protein
MPLKFCVSEKDAKTTKMCPLTMVRGDVSLCAGSACMAWRWVETYTADDVGDLTVVSGDTHGYCGLAGQWDPRR